MISTTTYKVELEGKKTAARTAYITEETRTAVENMKKVKEHKDDDEIFKKGRELDPYNNWTKKVNRFLKDNGGYTTHDFRRTAATNLYRDTNNNLLLVQKLLGHKNVETTRLYIEVGDEEVEKAMGEMF